MAKASEIELKSEENVAEKTATRHTRLHITLWGARTGREVRLCLAEARRGHPADAMPATVLFGSAPRGEVLYCCHYTTDLDCLYMNVAFAA